MPRVTEPAVSGFAWSPTADPASDWWSQRVYFDGEPVRRIDAAARLARTPGLSDAAARSLLETARIADGVTGPRPPWYWDGRVVFDGVPTTRRAARTAMLAAGAAPDAVGAYLDTAVHFDGAKGALDPEGRWVTTSGNHYHVTKDGTIDAGGPPAIREALAKRDGKGPESKEDKELRKSVSEIARADRTHTATVGRLEGGKKVNDARLKAAHDHHTKWAGLHENGLKEVSGPGGRPLPGQERDHAYHKELAERHGKALKTTSAELKKRDDERFHKDVAKSAARQTKADATHNATHDRVKAGEKVKRKDLQAAHDHFANAGDFHGEILKGLAGKDGGDILKVPHDHHMDLMGKIVDAHGKQEVLKGALDAHDKAKGERDKAKADKAEKGKAEKGQKAKAETPAPKPEAKPEPKVEPKDEGSKLPAHEIRQGLQKAFRNNEDGGYASMPDLFKSAQTHAPGLTKDQFHEHVKGLEKSGHLELHEHDNPSKLHPDDAAHGIKNGNELKYYAVGGKNRGDAQWAHGPHDDAADAAHKVVDSGVRNAAPPTRGDIFNALAHHGKLPATAAGAAAREVHAKLAEKGGVSQHEVREAVNRHASDGEVKKQNAANDAKGTAGTNHSAGAALNSLYEEKTGRTGHQPGQVSKKELPSKEDVAKHIETHTHGRLAGKSALRAAKDVHAHVLAHGHDFMSGHDFAGVLDKHAKNDFKHSSPEDVARAVRGGASVHPTHLQRAQNEASEHYQKASSSAHNLSAKKYGDGSPMSPKDAKRHKDLQKTMAHHGDHIDTINDALLRQSGQHEGKINEGEQHVNDAIERSHKDHDLIDSTEKSRAHADETIAHLQKNHTPAEIHAIAKKTTGRKGKAKDGSDSLKLIHTDLTAVNRMAEGQRV